MSKILKQLFADSEGQRTLRVACPLVATWWTGPSQTLLFSWVEINESNYRRWMDGVVHSGSKDHLLGYVRSLCHDRGTYRMQDLARDSGGYLSALRNLRILIFFYLRVEHVSEGEFHTCFSAFRETLTYLSLSQFSVSFSAFVTLVGYFPNITTLRLHSFMLRPDEGPVPSLSQPLRGKLHIHEVPADSLEFFSRFAQLDMEYEELVVDSFIDISTPGFAETALRISPSTVKFLRLGEELRCK